MKTEDSEPKFGRFPTYFDDRGSLGVIEFTTIEFQPRRIFWIYDVAEGETRANHGHRECKQIVFVQTGSIGAYTINRFGIRADWRLVTGEWLEVPPRHWLQLNEFAPGTVVGVLASHQYDPSEYINDPKDLAD